MEKLEFTIDFSDCTMLEADGEFSEVEKIMLSEISEKNWMISTGVFISSDQIQSAMTINLHGNKNVYITEYGSFTENVYYNDDLRFLSIWAQEYGWNIPQPTKDLILMDRGFWKHFWDILIIDSDYLDNIYGKRDIMTEKEIKKEEKSEELCDENERID